MLQTIIGMAWWQWLLLVILILNFLGAGLKWIGFICLAWEDKKFLAILLMLLPFALTGYIWYVANDLMH